MVSFWLLLCIFLHYYLKKRYFWLNLICGLSHSDVVISVSNWSKVTISFYCVQTEIVLYLKVVSLVAFYQTQKLVHQIKDILELLNNVKENSTRDMKTVISKQINSLSKNAGFSWRKQLHKSFEFCLLS